MSALSVLNTLEGLGVMASVTLSGNLKLEPASLIPPDLLAMVKRQKLALLELLGAAKEKQEDSSSLPDTRAAEVVSKRDNPAPIAEVVTKPYSLAHPAFETETVTQAAHGSPSAPLVPTPLEPLPAHLVPLFEMAQAGKLPRGAVKLSSGLVTDLASYVLAWAECWPRDRAHVLRRLEEAHAVTVKP